MRFAFDLNFLSVSCGKNPLYINADFFHNLTRYSLAAVDCCQYRALDALRQDLFLIKTCIPLARVRFTRVRVASFLSLKEPADDISLLPCFACNVGKLIA